MRLCQKIGYKGYQEFKIVLARDLVEPATEIYAAIEPGDDLATVKAKVFQANAQALRDTIEVLDDVQLAARGRRDRRAPAGSRSTASAEAARSRSTRTTSSSSSALHAVALSDGDLMAMSSALLGAGDVALGISHTGASRDVTDALGARASRTARRRSASRTGRRRRSPKSPTSCS